MLFYDIYLKDRLTGKYIPIPILINDYVDSLLNTPNTGSSSNFVFMRRFFLFDNLGGLETLNSYANGGSPSVYIKFQILYNFLNYILGDSICKNSFFEDFTAR